MSPANASKQKKILLVQTRSRTEVIEAERQNYRNALGEHATLECISSLDEELARKNPDDVMRGFNGVIFGGSSDYDFDGGRMANDPFRLLSMIILSRAKNLISYALAENIPILGICFGHQMIANMYGGEVHCDPKQKKSGTFDVKLMDEGKEDKLFKHLPKSFPAQYGHKDSVTKLPKGATLLAMSSACRFAALRYGENAYTVQFHPEITAERLIKNLNSSSDYLPEGVTDAATIVRESSDASKIIPLWIEKIVSA